MYTILLWTHIEEIVKFQFMIFSTLDICVEVCMHPITSEYLLKETNSITGMYKKL